MQLAAHFLSKFANFIIATLSCFGQVRLCLSTVADIADRSSS